MERISAQSTEDRLRRRMAAGASRRRALQAEGARYTLILHAVRKRLGLTLAEYCLADTIDKLSSTKSAVPGWCYASKRQLAEGIGVNERTLFRMIRRLQEKEIIESDSRTGYLRSSKLWWRSVEVTKSECFGR